VARKLDFVNALEFCINEPGFESARVELEAWLEQEKGLGESCRGRNGLEERLYGSDGDSGEGGVTASTTKLGKEGEAGGEDLEVGLGFRVGEDFPRWEEVCRLVEEKAYIVGKIVGHLG